MKKYLIVDTFNGEGYSDSNATIKEFETAKDAISFTENLANKLAFGGNDGVELGIRKNGCAWDYEVGDSNGAIHFVELPENMLAVSINPLVNDYDIITESHDLNNIKILIVGHSEEYIDEDEPMYGTCHHGIGNEGGDIILFSREMCEGGEVIEPAVTMSKDDIIALLCNRLSQTSMDIDDALDVLREHGLGQHEDDFALNLASHLAPNEELLIAIEKQNKARS